MIQGTSKQAAVAARTELDRVTAQPEVDAAAVGGELFGVMSLIDRESTLRRVIADPSRTATERAGLLDSIVADQVSDDTRAVLRAVVEERWSRPRDLTDTLEQLAVRATVASIRTPGELDSVEDELFRFRQIVVGNPQLRNALSDVTGPADRRGVLLSALLDGKVSGVTRRLIDQAVTYPRGRNLEAALDDYSRVVAERRSRFVAHVRTSVHLEEAQRERLATILERMYGHEVALNVELDPSVIGGLSVRVGDEVVDATVAGRLDEARRRLAG